jgi:hypothetical protein
MVTQCIFVKIIAQCPIKIAQLVQLVGSPNRFCQILYIIFCEKCCPKTEATEIFLVPKINTQMAKKFAKSGRPVHELLFFLQSVCVSALTVSVVACQKRQLRRDSYTTGFI